MAISQWHRLDRMRFLLFAAILGLLLAGCADEPDDEETDPGTPTTPGPAQPLPPQVFNGTGTITIAGGVGVTLTQGAEPISFTVDENATVLYAELTWDSDQFDLDLCLSSPDAGSVAGERNCDTVVEGGTPGAPDKPLAIALPAPTSGAWEATPVPNAVTADTTYHIAVTVFYAGTDVPDGYTALPPA